MQLDYLGLTCYSWHYAAHVSLFRHLATLLRNKWRSCTACSSHMDTRLQSGPYVRREAQLSSDIGTSLGNVRSLQRGSFVYGTRTLYMKGYSGHATGSLKEPAVVGHLQGRIPSCRTLLARGPARALVGIVGSIPGATPGPETRISLFTESGLLCEPSFGLGVLVGSSSWCQSLVDH